MIRDGERDAAVGAGCQDYRPSTVALGTQIGQQLPIIRQQRRVRGGERRQCLLQMRLAVAQRAERPQQFDRLGQRADEGFQDRIRAHQGAVEIDDEWLPLCRGERCPVFVFGKEERVHPVPAVLAQRAKTCARVPRRARLRAGPSYGGNLLKNHGSGGWPTRVNHQSGGRGDAIAERMSEA